MATILKASKTQTERAEDDDKVRRIVEELLKDIEDHGDFHQWLDTRIPTTASTETA
jgi:hemerythrin